MAKHFSNDSITLDDTQLQHFTGGDGLWLRDQNGDIIAFAHIDNLEGNIEKVRHKENVSEALAQLELLNMALFQGNEVLELNRQAQIGLQAMIENIQSSLTRYSL
jgi:hypothetical protein